MQILANVGRSAAPPDRAAPGSSDPSTDCHPWSSMPDYVRLIALPFVALLLVTGCAQKQSKAGAAPVPVTVTTARRGRVPYTIAANGTVMPLETANVASQVDGLVIEVTFREGQEVARGEVLFRV